MCRHVAYVGPEVRLADVLLDAPHALVTQARAPRHQLPGVTNEDGWGVAWWPGPRLHRDTTPLPDDGDGQLLLRDTTAPAFVAAVRRATPGLDLVETGNAPFVAGHLAFSLNGFVGGFTTGARQVLLDRLGPARRGALIGDTDSELLFGLVLDHLDGGVQPAEALAAVTAASLAAAGDRPSRLNLLLCDGRTVWATRHGNSLFSRPGIVASEPWDDGEGWVEVPEDDQVVTSALH